MNDNLKYAFISSFGPIFGWVPNLAIYSSNKLLNRINKKYSYFQQTRKNFMKLPKKKVAAVTSWKTTRCF